MVNANNAFGGKTGFQPVRVVVSVVNKAPDLNAIVGAVWVPGKSFIDDRMSPDFYLDCQRSDTQRKNGTLFTVWPMLGRNWNASFQREVDRQIPVLSANEAPEER